MRSACIFQDANGETIPDYFVVLEAPYVLIREAVAESLAVSDMSRLNQALEVGVPNLSCMWSLFRNGEVGNRRQLERVQKLCLSHVYWRSTQC